MSARQTRGQLKRDLKILNKRLNKKTEKEIRQLVFKIHAKTVLGTPVDTGLLRNSWKLTANNIDKTPGKPGTTLPTTPQLGSFKLGNLIFITNAVFYARYIEFGTAKIAARKMLGNAIRAVSRTIR